MERVAGTARKRSDQRQKSRVVPFRVSPDEYAALTQLANREALTVGSYIRRQSIERPTKEKPTTRARRRPTIEVQTVSALLGQLSKIGSNLNQIAKRANSGDRPLLLELDETLAACRQVAARAKDILDGNT